MSVLLTQAGGYLLTQAGGLLLAEGGAAAEILLLAGQARGQWAGGEARAVWTAGEARGQWSAEEALSVYSQSVLSTAPVQIPVTVYTPDAYDPTGDTVQFAFTPLGYPVTSPTAWVSGSWVTFPGPAYWAQCVIGPGTAAATALTIGTWQVWVMITDPDAVPVLQPTLLTITP